MGEKLRNLSSAAIIKKDPETPTMVSTETSSLCFDCSRITSSASQAPSSDFIRKRRTSTQLIPFNASCQVGDRRKRIKNDSFGPNHIAPQNPFSKKGHTHTVVKEEEQESEITQEKETNFLISRNTSPDFQLGCFLMIPANGPTYFRQEEKISTQLTLFDESWDNFFNLDFLSPKKFTNARDRIDLSGFRNQREETEDGVSTELKLYDDPWKIKKMLTKSDCSDNLHRLMFSKVTIERHVKPQLKKHGYSDEEIDNGIDLRVWDYDTETEHVVTFKKWVSNKSYIFGTNWKSQFVDRRGLKTDDEIGVFWNENEFSFGFRVLSRAPAQHLN